MTNEDIAVELKDHENQIKSLKHRMDKAEENDKLLIDIATSVKVMATNMEYMVKEQKEQGATLKEQSDRIQRLELEPAEDHKHYKKVIIGCILSSVVTALVAGLIALLLK